jgi:hypothetical protein
MLNTMSEEPIAFPGAQRRSGATPDFQGEAFQETSSGWGAPCVAFDRMELNRILHLYGRMVVAGEWRDYALDFLDDRAVFSAFRRTSEIALYRIEKHPKLRARQGQYAVIAASGHILKRGHDLAQVLRVLERKLLKALKE